MDRKDRIRAFIKQSFKDYAIRDDEDIFSVGFVNSLFAMQLVRFVEGEFQITIENEDLDIDNFRTIDFISRLVERKKAAVVS
jgi:acyl carrier protein